MALIKFQQIKTVYRLTKAETDFLALIPKNYKSSWDGKLQDLIAKKTLPSTAANTRNAIKKRIKEKLLAIQGPYCIFCGVHFDIVGTAQREHIAYKGKYPQFTFTNKNIALACAFCNGFEKKSTKNVVTIPKKKYEDCKFSIVHPYFDDIKKHIKLSFDGANISLSAQRNSSKGRNTIKLFKLMDIKQAENRGAAYLRAKELEKLKKAGIKKSKSITINKYTF